MEYCGAVQVDDFVCLMHYMAFSGSGEWVGSPCYLSEQRTKLPSVCWPQVHEKLNSTGK